MQNPNPYIRIINPNNPSDQSTPASSHNAISSAPPPLRNNPSTGGGFVGGGGGGSVGGAGRMAVGRRTNQSRRSGAGGGGGGGGGGYRGRADNVDRSLITSMANEGNQQMAALTSAMNAFQISSNPYPYTVGDGGGDAVQGSSLPPSLSPNELPFSPYYIDPNLFAVNPFYPYNPLTPITNTPDSGYLHQPASGSATLPPTGAYNLNALVAQQMAIAQGLTPFNNPNTVNVTTMPINPYSTVPMNDTISGPMGTMISAARPTPTFGSSGHGAEPPRKGKGPSREEAELRNNADVIDPLTYKTEVCRSFLATGGCDYGDSCQFAHGVGELRSREFDAKYKTELCKNYHLFGAEACSFGSRCKFIHDEYRIRAGEYEFWLISPSEYLVRVECVHPKNTARFEQLVALVNNPPKPPVSPLQSKNELKDKQADQQNNITDKTKTESEPGTEAPPLPLLPPPSTNNENALENPSETFQTPAVLHNPPLPPLSDTDQAPPTEPKQEAPHDVNISTENDLSHFYQSSSSSAIMDDPLMMLSRLPGLKEGVQPRLQFFTTAPSPKIPEKKAITQNPPQKNDNPPPPPITSATSSDPSSPSPSDTNEGNQSINDLAERQQKLLTLAAINEKNPPAPSPPPSSIDDQNKSDGSASDRDGDTGNERRKSSSSSDHRRQRKYRHRSSSAQRWQREQDDRSRAHAAALGLNLFDSSDQSIFSLPITQTNIQPGIAFLQNDARSHSNIRPSPTYPRINPPLPMNSIQTPSSSAPPNPAINVPFPFGMPLQFPSFHIPMTPSNVNPPNPSIGIIPPY